MGFGFGFQGLGNGFRALGFRVWGSGFRKRFRALGFRVEVFESDVKATALNRARCYMELYETFVYFQRLRGI